MKLDIRFQAFHYDYDDLIEKARKIGEELDDYIANNSYMSVLVLDRISLICVDIEHMKCRVRPDYRAAANPMNPYEYNVWTLFYEIPMPESEFVQVPEKELPTYIGKALLKVLEAQNVPVKIRKHFDRERFMSDVRDFFVNVKGCLL